MSLSTFNWSRSRYNIACTR
ncbi:hypothetical protein D030_2814A, partial [Vibrio parahaemolyticus AQ3810]